MELRTLRYFIAVLEAGSLSRAAGSLYVAQPALTAQIKKLEDELGAQLFDRSHAGVTPTPAGLQLYDDARRLLSDADAVRDRVLRLPTGAEGSVTVALPLLLVSLLMGPVLAALKRSHPRIRVFVLDGLSLTVQQAMRERRADIGILVDTPTLDDLHCRHLAREALYFCGRDPEGRVLPLLRQPRSRRKGAAQRPPEIAVRDALRQPLVLQSRRFVLRRCVEDAARELGVPLDIVHEHDSARVIRSLYLCGAGFTVTPACSLHESKHLGAGWVLARMVRPELERTYTLATSSRKPSSRAAQVVLHAIAHEVRRLIEHGEWDAQWLGRDWHTEDPPA